MKTTSPYDVHIIDSFASFSDDRAHRYDLGRVWDYGKPTRLWIMLNPSTADEVENDPTVERCFRRSIDDGYGSFVVCNIFALRSTDPRVLYKHADPIGEKNDEVILGWCRDVFDEGKQGQIVCAWGTHGRLKNRGKLVMETLLKASLPLHALGMSKREQPIHPLYVAYDRKPFQLYTDKDVSR